MSYTVDVDKKEGAKNRTEEMSGNEEVGRQQIGIDID